MEEFRAALAQYLVGSSDVEDLERALDLELTRPGSAPELAALLDQLFGSGRLPPQVFALLKRRLDASGLLAEPAPDGDGDRTRMQSPARTGGAPAEDRTQFRTPAAAPDGADEKTQLRSPSPAAPPPAGGSAGEGDADRTMLQPRRDSSQGAAVGPGAVPPGPASTGPGPDGTGGATAPGGTTSGSGWSHPSQWSTPGGAPGRPLDVGDRLQQGRYQLEARIGKGGMGTVYKARDLLQDEAQARNPFIAIKILNEDFKRHPKALQALQRETRKAQDLAHPNIVNVFGFDREGENVYMTMEYLEGQPLDRFNRRYERRGLPPEQAMGIIRGLAEGLAYAHKSGVVHSDFKPGNAFLTNADVVKIFDFGIARAAGTGADQSGEKTLFDAGELGALTPAYASCEMFEGKDPDPRDDIYALAIMAYELFSGRHPFDKRNAVEARDQKLVPAPIKGLSRRQWRALRHGLAFDREQRTPTVEAFLEELSPKQRPVGLIVTGGVAATLVVAIAGYGGSQYLEVRRVEQLKADLAQQDFEVIQQRIPELERLSEELVRDVLVGNAREGLVKYYENRVQQVWAPDDDRFDYPAALLLLAEAERFLPDSLALTVLKDSVDQDAGRELYEASELLDALIKAGVVIAADGTPNARSVIAKIARIDPESDRLATTALAFRQVAEARADAGALQSAQAVIASALEFAPEDPLLAQAQDQFEYQLQQLEVEARIAELETQLEAGVALLATPSELARYRDALEELAGLDADNAAVDRARRAVETELDARVQALAADGSYGEGYELLDRFAGIVSDAALQAQRIRLDGVAAAYVQRIEGLATALQQAVAADRIEGGADSALGLYEQLAAEGVSEARLEAALAIIADGYSSRALRASAEERWNDARASLREALALNPPRTTLDRLQRELANIDLAEAQESEARERMLAQQRQQRIDDLVDQFEGLLSGPRFAAEDARQALATLGSLERIDPAVVPSGAEARIGERLAGDIDQLRTGAQLELALEAVEEARSVLPEDARLAQLETDLRSESAARLAAQRAERVASARDRVEGFLSDPVFDRGWEQGVSSALASFEDLIGSDDAQAVAIRERLGALYLDDAQRQLDGRRLDNAERQLRRAQRYAPGLATLGQIEAELRSVRQAQQAQLAEAERAADITNLKANLRALAAARDVAQAETTLAELRRTAPQDAFVRGEAVELIVAAYAELVQRELDGDAPDRAEGLVARAEALAPGLAAVAALRARVDAYAPPAPTPVQVVSPRPTFDDPCANPALVGAGRNPRAACRDDLAGGGRGPVLVVIPAGGPFAAPIAIGRYEVTVRDFNQYCERTGSCTPRRGGDDTLPVTGVSAQEAEAFVSWLSDSSGARYRLPTSQEWAYAATAGGAQPSGDWNCEVRMNGVPIKGQSLISVTTGEANGWGLRNYVGNAQELVRAGAGWSARGGAYTDQFDRCAIDLEVRHSGAADPVTGFRVLREPG